MLTKDLSCTVKTVTNLKLPAATRHLKTYMLIREPEDLGWQIPNNFSSVFVPKCSDFAGSQNDVVHSDLLMEMSTKASEVKNILPKLDVS